MNKCISQIINACNLYIKEHPEISKLHHKEIIDKLMNVAMKTSRGAMKPDFITSIIEWEYRDLLGIC